MELTQPPTSVWNHVRVFRGSRIHRVSGPQRRAGSQAAMRLIESSGFDSMLRLDAKLDGTLNAGFPN